MRKITLSFGLLLMVHGANAQIVALNPQALGGWTLVGADQAALGQSTVLTLPAGAQVARSFPLSRRRANRLSGTTPRIGQPSNLEPQPWCSRETATRDNSSW
jgi:hypothetical protein